MICRLFLSQSQPFCWQRPRPRIDVCPPGARETSEQRQVLADLRALCTLLRGQEAPLPSSGPLRALTLEISEEAAPVSSWMKPEVPFDPPLSLLLPPGSIITSYRFQFQSKSQILSCLFISLPLPCHIVPRIKSIYVPTAAYRVPPTSPSSF